jgi:predicted Zn-dependent protease
MIVSTGALGSSFNTAKLESIAKHEIGHALGHGHTDFVGDLMSQFLLAEQILAYQNAILMA